MARPPLPCFHLDTLRENYAQQIAIARSQRVLDQVQYQRFNSLCQNPWPAAPELSIYRLSCPALDDHPEFADALMIIEGGVKTTEVYLCLPLRAIERFPDRLRFDQALLQRYGRDVPTATEIVETPLAASIFSQWMDNLLTRQEGHLTQLDRDLLNLPTLQDVLNDALTTELRSQAPEHASDPDHWCYQVIQRTAPQTVVQSRSLLEVAMDDFCHVADPSGATLPLRLIAPDGTTCPAATQSGLKEAASSLAGRYDDALKRYWQQTTPSGLPRQRHAADALRHIYYLALLELQRQGHSSTAEISWLRKVLRADLGAANGAVGLSTVALHSGQRAGIGVTAALVVSEHSPASGPLYVFTPRKGLVRLADLPALDAWLTASAQDVLLQEAIGLDNRGPYKTFKQPSAQLTPLARTPFAQCVEAIQDQQRRNISAAIAQRGTMPEQVAVVLDDAIDVRGLLAPALLKLDQSPRWSTAEIPTLTPSDDNAVVTPNSPLSRVLELQSRFALIQDAVPSLESCLRHLLDLRLAQLDGPTLNATNVWIQRGAARDTLLLLAMEQSSATPPAALTSANVISGVDKQTLTGLDHLLLNRWLRAVGAQVKGLWSTQFHRFNQQPSRLGDYQIDAHRQSLFIRQQALREELALEATTPDNAPWAQQWLRQILDRPRRAMRLALGDAAVECNRLSVLIPGQDFAMPFTNVMALTQSVVPDGQLLFCSHRHGLLPFDDQAALATQINRLLDGPAGREQWLKLFAERHQPKLRAHLESADHSPLVVRLSPVDGNYAHVLQRGEETRQIFTAEAAFNRARKGGYPPSLWLAYVDEAASGLRLGDQLDELELALKGAVLDLALPTWLRQASSADLDLYTHNLERVRQNLAAPQRFLFGVETATEFATQQVDASLTLDFPEASPNPDLIRVRVREKFKTGLHFSGATEGMATSADGIAFPTLELSLVQYSLHRFIAQPDLPLEVRTADGSALLDGLDPLYVGEMVARLDTGGHYLQHLQQLFAPSHPDYPKRQALFREQIPPALMDIAIEGKLKKQLSAEAFQVIEALIDMPDPTARQMPDGRDYYLRPLCLLADASLAPDPAAGLHLLGSKAGEPGPLVLLATYHEDFAFREFASEADLLVQLRKPGKLQDLVLQRVAPDVRSRYANGGLLAPNFEVSAGPHDEQPVPKRIPAQLTFAPVPGNTMDYLLEQSLAFLLRAARAQVVTSEQADHAANLRLLELLGETGLSLLSGRLALAVSAWQSEQWFESSVASAASQEWGEAVSKFIAALSTVLSHRRARIERLEPVLPVATESSVLPVFSWRAGSIPLNLQALLRSFEARDIKLKSLRYDSANGLYRAATGERIYAPVGGHVYELRQRGQQWHIVDRQRQGPDVRRGAGGHWELDLQWGLHGGGAGWSQQRAERVLQREVSQEFITEAVGMPAIRAFALEKALKIGNARLHAKDYLERSLEALSPTPGQPALSVPVLDTLRNFFDVATPSPQLIGAIKHQVGQIFGELMDASLNLHSSQRYVIGRNRPGREAVLAFVDHKDPQRRLFLTDTFFTLPDQLRATLRSSQRGFEVADHFRATTLIHELSHLANLTVDIAYVEASAPFLDLIDSTAPGPRTNSLLHDLKVYQQETLTARTPPSRLFKMLENGHWRDIDASDGRAYQQVLALSGERTLPAARTKFLNDAEVRSRVMLANADSIALLITLLARHPLPRAVSG